MPGVFSAIVLMLALLGCAADERQSGICRQIVATLVEDARDLAALPVEHDGMVRFAVAGAGRHEITCRFAGGALSADRLDLLSVEEDGAALTEIRMILLRHLIGLPTPQALHAAGSQPPLAVHAAYLVQLIINDSRSGPSSHRRGRLLPRLRPGYRLPWRSSS
jgi:hypothetical protein